MGTASDFTFTTRYIHNWALFLLSPNCFILSGVISNCPLIFLSSILDTFQLRGLISWCHIFLPFHTVHGVFQARIMVWVAISFSRGPGFVFSVQFSHSVMSDSLRPHELQHARRPCPSPTPGVHPDSHPSSQWCHPAILSSVVPFSSCPNPSQHQSLFQWVNSSREVAKVLEFQL